MRRKDRKFGEIGRRLEGSLHGTLASKGFTIARGQPVGPAAQVDIIARDPRGLTFAIEVKAGAEGDYLPVSAVAQARGTAEFMGSSGFEPIPVVYTNLQVSKAAQAAAAAMKVPIVQASDNSATALRNFANALKSHSLAIPLGFDPT